VRDLRDVHPQRAHRDTDDAAAEHVALSSATSIAGDAPPANSRKRSSRPIRYCA
jgi:hypothetical protein